jgi:uncharacterized damage-inducible protein DinB
VGAGGGHPRDRLVTALSDAADHTTLSQLSGSLADAEAHLLQVEERWLALAEQLDGDGSP